MFFVCLMVICSFFGCTGKKQQLRVLIDENGLLGSYHSMVASALEDFQSQNKDIDIEIETLPKDENGRREMFQRLQTEIMAGKGPDVFVLPCHYLLDRPLIQDVNQAMRNGMFADLNVYYDADQALGKESLIPAVMDAGVVDGKRYVLPLWYDLPVFSVNRTLLTQTGFDADLFSQGYLGAMSKVEAAKASVLAADLAEFSPLLVNTLNLFPQLIDYDSQQILLTKAELTEFAEKYHALGDIQESRQAFWERYIPMDLGFYIEYGEDLSWWASKQRAVEITGLNVALANVAIAKMEGIDLEIVPMTAADGTLIADVTLWGAVSARCENEELAYSFLRLLLSEECQWEAYRLDETSGDSYANKGWPVRARNGISPFYRNSTLNLINRFTDKKLKSRATELQNIEMVDDCFPDFYVLIDQAQFSIPGEASLGRILQSDVAGETEISDVLELSEQWLKELEWHLYEG